MKAMAVKGRHRHLSEEEKPSLATGHPHICPRHAQAVVGGCNLECRGLER